MPKNKKSTPHPDEEGDNSFIDGTVDTEASTDDEDDSDSDDEEGGEVAEGGEDGEDDEEEEEEEEPPRDYYHIHADADDLERAGNYTPDALLCGSVRIPKIGVCGVCVVHNHDVSRWRLYCRRCKKYYKHNSFNAHTPMCLRKYPYKKKSKKSKKKKKKHRKDDVNKKDDKKRRRKDRGVSFSTLFFINETKLLTNTFVDRMAHKKKHPPARRRLQWSIQRWGLPPL